jgi:ubiquinone biosynthesis protein
LLIKKKSSFLGIRPLSPIALKESIIALGASFIKLAQVLATRSDFFSSEYLNELKELHDSLPPMKKQDFEKVYNRAFGKNNIFKFFEEIPIASASIGQVHIAYLPDNTKVAVKLRREGIKDRIKADIKIISFFNHVFHPLFSTYTKNSIEAVIGEFSKMIQEEVSLDNELRNLKEFSKIYDASNVIFPMSYDEFCSDDALVMSYEEGFRFDDKENLKKYNIDFKLLISKLVNFYTQQMLINGFFHADPHPGNLLVNTKGELILLDFGMVKRVPNHTRIAIIELIKAANDQDYELYISANKRLGTIAYEAPTTELAEFTAKMFAIFSNENLSNESMQKLAFEVLETTKDLPFKLPSDAIYILRVSAIIEGLGTTYIENFNGIKDILPILKDNIPKAINAKGGIFENIISLIKDTPFVIQDIRHTFKKIANDDLKIELSNDQLRFVAKEIKNYIASLVLPAILMLSAFFMINFENLKSFSLVLFFSGAILFWYRKN